MNIRDVPERVHAVLARRAAQHGMSLRAYTVSVLADHAALPTIDEWLADLEQLPEAGDDHPAADALRAARDEADRGFARSAGRR